MDEHDAWLGRSETRTDRLSPPRCNALLAALGRDAELKQGDPLPPLHHWLHFWDVRAPAETGIDGHPKRGGFLPPVALPRRMWAGGRFLFRARLRLGESVRKVSTIRSIERKSGRSGELVFVTVAHAVHGEEGLAIEEEQDLVYREEGRAPPAPAAEPQAEPDAAIEPDAVLLFRYSALTMNSHRIHYDRDYARAAEHYPDLVVHGPLQATLLAALAAERLGGLSSFRYRGVAPAFAGETLHLHARASGEGLDLWTSQANGTRMTASAAI
jgi:3-methylfumaryl-CoA hydratase